jgi:hypothetical protein
LMAIVAQAQSLQQKLTNFKLHYQPLPTPHTCTSNIYNGCTASSSTQHKCYHWDAPC